jgi:hypothetical protein
METTFRIQGRDENGLLKNGTGFIMGKPIDGEPTMGRYVLVTAAHVLEDIREDFAILNLRVAKGQNEWSRLRLHIKIRRDGKPVWTKHPEEDVAAMYLLLPEGVAPLQLSAKLLADDDMLRNYGIHPGDNLSCLGFPLGIESGKEGFPILRSGKIASFPLLPTKKTKTFLFDFEVFEGNSGGPVYFVDSNRTYDGVLHLGQTNQFVVGLVKGLMVRPEMVNDIPLKLAEVIHASLIKETIALLP